MTRHAIQHADCVTRKSSHSLNSNRSRNPWTLDRKYLENTNSIISTNSSRSRAPTYCTLSGPGPPAYPNNFSDQHSQCYRIQSNPRSMTMPRLQNQKLYPVYVERSSSVRANPANVHRNPVPRHFDYITGLNSGCSTSRTSSDRPVTPASLSMTDGIFDPCGGHCRTFERFCRYLLQVLFMMGILVGVSLVLAAYWLHSQRKGGDQLVLVYIGVLMALVCTLLLSIQCSAELEVKRKKRNRRASAALLARNRVQSEVPLRELGTSNRIIYNSREAEDVPEANMYSQVPLLYPGYRYEMQSKSCDEMSQSQNGIPWWRRHELEVTPKNIDIV